MDLRDGQRRFESRDSRSSRVPSRLGLLFVKASDSLVFVYMEIQARKPLRVTNVISED